MHMVTAGTHIIPRFKCTGNNHVKGQLREKTPVLSVEKCLFLVLLRNPMLRHLIIQFPLYYSYWLPIIINVLVVLGSQCSPMLFL